jgi:hypothetical protein
LANKKKFFPLTDRPSRKLIFHGWKFAVATAADCEKKIAEENA